MLKRAFEEISMRSIGLVAAFVAVAGMSAAAVGQLTGGARRITGRAGAAVEEHNQAVEDAMNEGLGRPTPRPAQQPGQPAQPSQEAAPQSNGDVKAGWITRKSRDGKEVRLYFAHPANLVKNKRIPGLLVLQEWWGVNDDIQERTREFAAKGFYAVAPDLYYGKVTDSPEEAAKLKGSMTDAAAMTAMKTGLDLLQDEVRLGSIDAAHVGAIGWCMGGQQALLLSVADPRVKATALFYGPLVTDAAQLKSLQGPVLGVFGNDDKAPSPADVEKFKAGLKEAGKKDVTVLQFDGVGHAFASKSAAKMGAYNEEKAKEAWAKTWEWLDAKLPRKN
jgi:carboxymethylenebutenolidase